MPQHNIVYKKIFEKASIFLFLSPLFLIVAADCQKKPLHMHFYTSAAAPFMTLTLRHINCLQQLFYFQFFTHTRRDQLFLKCFIFLKLFRNLHGHLCIRSFERFLADFLNYAAFKDNFLSLFAAEKCTASDFLYILSYGCLCRLCTFLKCIIRNFRNGICLLVNLNRIWHVDLL